MRLLERLRTIGLQRRLARATVDAYAAWVEQFLRFCCRPDGTWRRAEEVGGEELEAFLTHLVRDRRLSASTQNQALCAVVFLYRRVIFAELGDHKPEGMRQVQTLLGHSLLETTMIYTHVMNKPSVAVTSPLSSSTRRTHQPYLKRPNGPNVSDRTPMWQSSKPYPPSGQGQTSCR